MMFAIHFDVFLCSVDPRFQKEKVDEVESERRRRNMGKETQATREEMEAAERVRHVNPADSPISLVRSFF